MQDREKTPVELVRELAVLRERLAASETREARHTQVETALTETRKELEELLTASPTVIYRSEPSGSYAVTFVGKNVKRQLGYEPHEFTKDPRFWADRIHPEDAPRVLAGLSDLCEKELQAHEYRFLHKDGSYRWILDEVRLVRNASGGPSHVVGSRTDITNQKDVDRLLQERERFLSNVFSSIQDGISVLDTDLTILRVNPTMERWYTHAMPLVGKKCFLAYHGREEACETCPTRRTLKTKQAAYEVVPKTGVGGKVVGWLDLYSFPLFDSSTGRLNGVIEYVRDITDRKRAEDHLRQSQKMEAIGRLAGRISHDLNNLLTAIGTYADLLLLDIPRANSLSLQAMEIRNAVEQAASLTRQLLAFSRKQVLQPRVIDPNAIVDSMEGMLRRLLGESIELDILAGADVGHVKADPGQLEQVILNLTLNARDAMPKGGKLTLETADVYLDEEQARGGIDVAPGPYVMLTVADTGCGMDEEIQSHVFEPFFTTKERDKGTGLGLATVFGIVRQSRGGIWFHSKVGEGTTFKVYLPRVRDALDATERDRGPATSVLGSETILLVEDETSIRKALRQALQRSGYRILEASNPGEALLISEQHPGFIHLMLTDVVMPRMSGPELAERLESWHPEMKVLYMSGHSEDDILEDEILSAGVAFLRKPFSIQDLLENSRRVLDEPKRGKELGSR
jgi:two-component system, cell cycle sensor histidine kinase and response regulator CckA